MIDFGERKTGEPLNADTIIASETIVRSAICVPGLGL